MKDKARNNQFRKTELTVRNENELRDAIHIFVSLGYSNTKIFDSNCKNLYRYR